jgi:hypothetical protein
MIGDAATRAIVLAVAGGHLSPAEGLELVALVEAQRAAVECFESHTVIAGPVE